MREILVETKIVATASSATPRTTAASREMRGNLPANPRTLLELAVAAWLSSFGAAWIVSTDAVNMYPRPGSVMMIF